MTRRDSRSENRFLFLMLAAVAVVGLFTSGIMGDVFGSDDATGLAVYDDAGDEDFEEEYEDEEMYEDDEEYGEDEMYEEEGE